jgi:hypothetical protein
MSDVKTVLKEKIVGLFNMKLITAEKEIVK